MTDLGTFETTCMKFIPGLRLVGIERALFIYSGIYCNYFFLIYRRPTVLQASNCLLDRNHVRRQLGNDALEYRAVDAIIWCRFKRVVGDDISIRIN